MTIPHIIILLSTGIGAGFAGGLLGIGGGFIMTPVQYMIFTDMGLPTDTAIKLAFGTTLLVIFPIAHISNEIINLYKWGENGVAELVHGNKYVILSENILKISKRDETNITNTNNITITTGGSDPEGVMITLIEWLINEPVEVNITALIGDAFMHNEKLDSLIGSLPENLKVVPFSYEELQKANLVVTTFGITLYELLYLGIPAICIAHSTDNSIDASILKERCDCFEDLGYIKKLESAEFISLRNKLITDKKEAANTSNFGSG